MSLADYDPLRYSRRARVHHEGFAGSYVRVDVTFDKIITARDVTAHKPAPNHFIALGIAQRAFHDHVPARSPVCPRC